MPEVPSLKEERNHRYSPNYYFHPSLSSKLFHQLFASLYVALVILSICKSADVIYVLKSSSDSQGKARAFQRWKQPILLSCVSCSVAPQDLSFFEFSRKSPTLSPFTCYCLCLGFPFPKFPQGLSPICSVLNYAFLDLPTKNVYTHFSLLSPHHQLHFFP